MKSFENKVVVITGGSSGIGKAVAKSFYEQGAKVVIFGRNELKLKAIVEEFSNDITAIQGDISKLSDLDNLYRIVNEIHGEIDVLVANAGISDGEIVDNVDEAHFDKVMNIDVKGTYFSVQKAVSFLASNASIVMVSSMACHGGWKGLSVYLAAKAAVSVLAKSFSADLIDREIRVNSVSPGFTDIPIFDDPDYISITSKMIPVKRFATA